MATRRTKAELDAIAAEAAADAAAPAPEPAKAPIRRRKAVVVAPVAVERTGPAPDAYRLTAFDGATKDDVYSWTATVLLGSIPVARVSWSGAKKSATVLPLAKTSGAADEVKKFEATAKRLLPGRDSITDLVTVLSFTAETGITGFNRVALLRSIPGSADIAYNPTLITAEVA